MGIELRGKRKIALWTRIKDEAKFCNPGRTNEPQRHREHRGRNTENLTTDYTD
jgi:hypothetical protein